MIGEIKTEFWSKEQIEEHLKKVGAWDPPVTVKSNQLMTTAAQVSHGRTYRRRGDEW
ncbi:hypothetical protein Q5741_18760 [Paenibacillus sp. JX-17]|uniref:Uncharacterized protein n=1 Tax=Paenibacillus lacisoli TaxID=3064525 RepID=A0ABT9CGW6_9BACL|nr:hypothetical protein [Paenibacillus sp. JX-17]MDO7908446.1 hypothetical protein [Paenibacillus sp. JX-17]